MRLNQGLVAKIYSSASMIIKSGKATEKPSAFWLWQKEKQIGSKTFCQYDVYKCQDNVRVRLIAFVFENTLTMNVAIFF